MTKRLKNPFRICRQVNEDIWGKFYSKLNYKKRPGQHGEKKKKIKDFVFLFNKDERKRVISTSKYDLMYKIKKFYINISKKHFDKILIKSSILSKNNKYNVNQNSIFNTAERRIDSIVFRSNFATTFYSARQLISHGHVLVNNKVITSSSYLVNVGDKVQINPEYQDKIKQDILNNLEKKIVHINVPDYIEVNYNNLSAILIYSPKENIIPYPTITNINELRNY